MSAIGLSVRGDAISNGLFYPALVYDLFSQVIWIVALALIYSMFAADGHHKRARGRTGSVGLDYTAAWVSLASVVTRFLSKYEITRSSDIAEVGMAATIA